MEIFSIGLLSNKEKTESTEGKWDITKSINIFWGGPPKYDKSDYVVYFRWAHGRDDEMTVYYIIKA